MTIYEQLKAYCDCADANEKDIKQLIELISMATCWTHKPCETFLSSERREVVDLPDCLEDCGVYTFTPFYAPFEVKSFEFTLVKQTGMTEETSKVEYFYSEVDEAFKLDLPLPSCKCKGDSCGCDPTYKLVVEYVAGYDLLPECILPVFCEALIYINEMNECDCEDCAPCNPNEYEVRTVDYSEGATLTDRLADYFVKTLTVQYLQELSLISLCERASDIWGFVV